MEKRALIAVILSLLVLYIFQAHFTPPEKPVQPSIEKSNDEPLLPESVSPVPEKEGLFTFSDISPTDFPEKEIRVETPLYTAIFSTRGAALKSWTLKKYLDHLGIEGKPIEMITDKGDTLHSLSMTLLWKKRSQMLDIQFQPDREILDLSQSEREGQITFTGTTRDGVLVKKIITFFPKTYWIEINVEITPPVSFPANKGAIINWVRKLDPERDVSNRFSFIGPVVYVNEKLKKIKLKHLDEGKKTFSRGVNWVGYDEKYFLAAFFSRKKALLLADIIKTEQDSIVINCYEKPSFSQSNGSYVFSYDFYCGPKDIEILRSLGVNLEKVIDFGMFDIIAKPLLYILKYLNKLTHNYGLAIIILTVIIKIIFFPLTHKSYKSMKAMKDLQPKIIALKEKYKDDKERLNREIINLYRTYKVNPLGGCLPLLIQFPIFIAFYWVLLGSIELRHAPFMLWIKDLSAHDPYFVTPILMGISMFIQQKMTPTAGDPTQAKVMLAMPVIFTFLFLKFPAGLVLYWLVNNILQIFQQLYIEKRIA